MAFPSVGALDDFNRANQNPPSSSWSAITPLGNLAVVSNQCKANAAGNCGNYWNVQTFGPDCEAYITIVTKGGTGDSATIVARGQGTSSGLTIDGYAVNWTVAAGTDSIVIQRIDNGAPTTLDTISQEMNNGDQLGIKIIGDTIEAYVNGSLVGSATDSTYSAAGDLAVLVVNTTFVLDDFGGGTAYAESGAAIASGVGDGHGVATGPTYAAFQLNAFQNSAFQIYNSGGGASYNETGAGVAGAIASGTESQAYTDAGAGVANAIASGAESIAAFESAAAVANAIASGADRLTWTETAAGIAGGIAAGVDAAGLADGGYGLAEAVASGAETYTPAGGASYNETGAGVAGMIASGADVAALIDAGYSIAGAIASGADALAYAETGAGIVAGIANGADAFGGADTGAGVASVIAVGYEWSTVSDSGYGLAMAVASGNDSLTTAGDSSKIDYTRQAGNAVDQDGQTIRAPLTAVVQSQVALRGKGSKVA